MNQICADGATVHGYDVSGWQTDIRLHARMTDSEFAFIKADEGTRIVDRMCAAHRAELKRLGKVVGFYNFFHPSQDPVLQADHFHNVVGKLGPGDLGPVIDWETADGIGANVDRERGFAYLVEVEKQCGKTPIIYGAPYFLKDLALDARFLKYPLWIANYGVSCPLMPPPFRKWTFWQYTGTGLDLNYFNGNSDQLKLLAGMP